MQMRIKIKSREEIENTLRGDGSCKSTGVYFNQEMFKMCNSEHSIQLTESYSHVVSLSGANTIKPRYWDFSSSWFDVIEIRDNDIINYIDSELENIITPRLELKSLDYEIEAREKCLRVGCQEINPSDALKIAEFINKYYRVED